MTERSPSLLPPLSVLVPWLVIAIVIVVLDQITKVQILEHFQHKEGIFVTSFFNIVRDHNPGAAWSFLASASGWQRWLFTGFAICASVFIIFMLRRHGQQKAFSLALSLILGGAIGNVIDRILHGYVVDFLQFHYAGWYFPSFNVADAAITVGAVLLVADEFRKRPPVA